MSEATEPSPWIVDADEATFQQEVVERSRQLPVVVDFWAVWCQPCVMLGPLLEKLARDYDGKFLLVKAETEKVPNVAASFGVDAIPAVYALRDGALVDFFVGLRDERQLRAWIDRLLPSPAETLVAEARAVEATDAASAEGKFREAIALDANLATAQIGLARVLLAQGRADESRAIIDELEKRGYLEDDAEKVKAQLQLSGGRHPPREIETLRAKVAAEPANLQAALELAEALAADSTYEEALETALRVVQAGRKEFVEQARVLMVNVLRLLPEDSPLVSEYRRRLSTALY
ncbi:MAG: tetratricopeptide repeat protein [Pirellulales bacterium]